jgi:diguanylate cyclase (GGDEF)-like protein
VLDLQNRILEMVARGDTLKETVDALCLAVEQRFGNVLCSVLAVDQEGRLHPLSGPSLPSFYSAALDGLAIGPQVGSCGTAAFLQLPVIVEDIASDPRWTPFRDLARRADVRACWSSPIFSSRGGVIGTFALYYRETRGPTLLEQDLVAACTHLCAIALERHERVVERERRSYVDDLTQLPNRACLQRDLADLSSADNAPWGMMVIDLDNLKVVNDTFGHNAGDSLIRIAASRIQDSCSPNRVYRQGGDEFVVLVHDPSSILNLQGLGERLLSALTLPAECDGNTIVPRATVGTAHSEDGDAETVRRYADFALYHAKEQSRGTVAHYSPRLGARMAYRAKLVRHVEAAIEDGRIDAYYQPIVELSTQRIVGLEALCRIINPDGSVQPAAEFQEATSDIQVSSKLTARMMEIVARDLSDWLAKGISIQHVGVNVSSADFHTGRLAEHLADAFGRHGVPLKHVIVEVTESVFIGRQDPAVARTMEELRSAGLLVAFDDFGTGYASLTHLLSMPVDIMKIDRSFVSRMDSGLHGITIVEGLLRIAKGLGIRVVAEGIETQAQALLLRELGCTLGQGYLYSHPLDRAAATRALQKVSQTS